MALTLLGILGAGCAETGDAADGGLPWGETFIADSIIAEQPEHPPPPGTRIQLSFTDGRIGASVGCNHIAGPVRDDSGRLAVADLSTTLIGCPPEIAELESVLMDFLDDSPLWSLQDGKLRLWTETTELRLTVVDERAQALVGTGWVLESIIDRETASSVPAGVSARIELGPDSVTGETTCGSFDGDANASVETVTFVRVTFAESADVDCGEGARTVADALRGALAGEVGFTIDGDRLTLTPPTGPALQFRAAD